MEKKKRTDKFCLVLFLVLVLVLFLFLFLFFFVFFWKLWVLCKTHTPTT